MCIRSFCSCVEFGRFVGTVITSRTGSPQKCLRCRFLPGIFGSPSQVSALRLGPRFSNHKGKIESQILTYCKGRWEGAVFGPTSLHIGVRMSRFALAAGRPCRIISQFSGRRLELALGRTKARNLALFREFPRANLGTFRNNKFLFFF